MALVLRETAQPIPFLGTVIGSSQRARYTLRVNGVRTGSGFDRLVDAVDAIQGKPLGNNYEIYAEDRRIFTFGVCLRTSGDISLSASRPRRSRAELS